MMCQQCVMNGLTAQALLNQMQEVALDEAVILETIRLRETHRIKLPDAIIAASALAHGLRLMTRNVADFKSTGVLLLNPWEEQSSP